MPILKIEKLTKKYGKTYALNGLDMEVKKGDIYGFVGPNGAGKTTTLRIISGLLKSDGGDLWLDGVRTTKNILKQKSLIGFVPDFFGVYENLSVIEYLEFFAASYGIYGRAGTVRAREVLEMVELSGKEEQMVDSLSRGIQQRLCLARAMIHKPKLLVLDEKNAPVRTVAENGVETPISNTGTGTGGTGTAAVPGAGSSEWKNPFTDVAKGDWFYDGVHINRGNSNRVILQIKRSAGGFLK